MHIDDPEVSRFVFHPRPEPGSHRPAGLATHTASGSETIGGYLFLHPKSDVLMLFFHGNGEIAADYDALARFYTGCGVTLWAIDYRGYGNSTGTPSFTHMFTDAEAVFQDIAAAEKAAGRSFDKVIVMGRSLGSASAISLAATHPQRITALVLDSPFADGPALVNRIGGPSLSADALSGFEDNLDRIKAVRQPCLIIHGTQDWIIPVSDADALHAACPSADKRLVKIENAGHNDLLMRGFDTYFAEIRALVARMPAAG
jgi:pimeloyl-ACP methyl ester carboxylesterase